MSIFDKMGNLVSIISYDGDNETLVYKHPIEDFNMGSQLIVHESQEAVFFRDGQALDVFGPGRYELDTQKLPMLDKLCKLYLIPIDDEMTFHSEVYFVNRATQMGLKWGTDSKVRLFDPASGLHVELGASGEFSIRVVDSRKLLLKLVGTSQGLSQSELLGADGGKGIFRALVMTQVKSRLAQAIKASGISVLEIDEHLLALSDMLRAYIDESLAEYGLTVPEFFVSRVVTPDDDPNYRRMKEQYAEQYLLVRQEQIKKSEAEAAQARKLVEAQTQAQIQVTQARGAAEAHRLKAEAEADEMRMKGYSYQQETARKVGMEAMKNGLGGPDGAGGIAGIGVSLGAMSSVAGMTKEALSQAETGNRQEGLSADVEAKASNLWDCACGRKGNDGNFCPECGAKRPQLAVDGWTCPACGAQGLTGKFCTECGKRKEER